MPRYIDAEQLLQEDFTHHWNDITDQPIFEHLIEVAPTADVVEVVRCRNCCWCMVTSQPYAAAYCIKGTRSFIVEADDFCSCGERKK